MLIFSLVFPPGSIDSAWAQNTTPLENYHDTFTTKIQKTYMALSDMLMVQRFPDAPRLRFQKPATEQSLAEARQTLDEWQTYLNDDWKDLLLKTSDQENENKMHADAESLALEAFMYFQSHYLYLGNLAFLRKLEPNEITRLIKQTELRIPIESVANYRFYFRAIVRFMATYNELTHGGKLKTEVRIDRCEEGLACLIFSMNEAKAYRALETPLKYRDDNEAFQHFSRLLVLENYVTSFANLEYFLDLPDRTLQIPNQLTLQHPSLQFLYEDQKHSIRSQFKNQFYSWLLDDGPSGGGSQLKQAFDILDKDPKADLINEEFLKKYTKILGIKAKDAKVLQKDFLSELKVQNNKHLINDFMIIFKLWSFFDNKDNFLTDALFDTLILIKNMRIKTELLSVPNLDKGEQMAINALITNELKQIKKRLNNPIFKEKVSSLYPNFKKSKDYPSHEAILHEMHNTIEQLNAFRGVDYQSLLAGVASTKQFRNLGISDDLEKIYNSQLIGDFEKDSITEDKDLLAGLQTKLAEKYYLVLLLLYRNWTLARKAMKDTVPDEALWTLKDLAAACDPDKVKPYKNNETIKNSQYKEIKKNLYDWIQIGILLKIHDGNQFISDFLANVLNTDDSTPLPAISLKDFSLDEKGLAVYQTSLEQKISSRFPLLSARSTRTERIAKGMDSARRVYDVPINVEKPLWKHLSGKDYNQTRPELIKQMQSTKAYIQQQIHNLAADTNKDNFFDQLKNIAARLKLTQLDENNINLPEVLILHLSYSTILGAELADYSKRERLGQFRSQYFNKSDFHKALEEYLNYSGMIFIGMIAFRVLSWASFFRVPGLIKLFPSMQKTSSAITRDGMTSVFGTAAKFRGQPIMLFGATQTWFDLSFWGTLLSTSGLALYQGIDSFNNEIPKLTATYENQVACRSGNADFDGNCDLDKISIDARESQAKTALVGAASGFAIMGGLLYALPKALAWFQKMQNRVKLKSSKKYNKELETLVRDLGQVEGKFVSFSLSDVTAMTRSILKEFKQGAPNNTVRQEMGERIFVLKRYLELRKLIQTENTFWNSVDSALAIHWQRLGIKPGTPSWNQRYSNQFISEKQTALRTEFNSGRLSAVNYEKLSQDIQTIESTLQPAWKLISELGSAESGMYARLVDQTMRSRIGHTSGIPTYNTHEITKRTENTYSAVFHRVEKNAQGEIALLRFAPYELRPEALKLMEKMKSNQLLKTKRDRQRKSMDGQP